MQTKDADAAPATEKTAAQKAALRDRTASAASGRTAISATGASAAAILRRRVRAGWTGAEPIRSGASSPRTVI